MSNRPRIVGVARHSSSCAVCGVLCDGVAKLAFVRTSRSKRGDEVLTGKKAKSAMSRGSWIPALRLHNCFRVAEVVTVKDGDSLRRITIVEVKLEPDNIRYIVVSQIARKSGGYDERFRIEDSLIGDWFCIWAKDQKIKALKDPEVENPSYQYLIEAARSARKQHATNEMWAQFDLSEVMAFAMTGW